MKKILYVITQSEFGGAQRYVFDLATNLKNEFEIMVAAGRNKNSELFEKLTAADIKTVCLKHLRREINPWRDFLAFFELRRLIKTERPDIIHLNSSKAGILGSFAAKCAVLRISCCVIYTAHGWVFNEPLNRLKKGLYLWLEKFTTKFKDKIICVSEYDRQIALKYGFPTEKLVTIHNGIDAEQISFLGKEDARRDLLNLVAKTSPHSVTQSLSHSVTKVIGAVANLYSTKGIAYLITAAHILYTKYLIRNTCFVVIGEGPERKKLESQIKKHGLEKNFFLAGSAPGAHKFLKAFDLFVLPSVKEGFPYAILEAMAAGLPIVASRAGGIPEAIENGKTGLLAEPKNSQELAEKIILLLKSPQIAAELSECAREKAKEKFSLEKMISETKKIYAF